MLNYSITRKICVRISGDREKEACFSEKIKNLLYNSIGITLLGFTEPALEVLVGVLLIRRTILSWFHKTNSVQYFLV